MMDDFEQIYWRRMRDYMDDFIPRPSHAIQSKPNAPIKHLRPHYTDDRFKDAQTVYLAQGHTLTGEYVKGAAYNYSDRYRSWFSDELYTGGWEAARKVDKDRSTAASIEAFLRHVHQDPDLKLVHIMAGFNVSNGYDYQVYGFIEGAK
jgi:hypothetical protein